MWDILVFAVVETEIQIIISSVSNQILLENEGFEVVKKLK